MALVRGTARDTREGGRRRERKECEHKEPWMGWAGSGGGRTKEAERDDGALVDVPPSLPLISSHVLLGPPLLPRPRPADGTLLNGPLRHECDARVPRFQERAEALDTPTQFAQPRVWKGVRMCRLTLVNKVKAFGCRRSIGTELERYLVSRTQRQRLTLITRTEQTLSAQGYQ